MESLIRADTVKFRTQRDELRAETKIRGEITLYCQTSVSDFLLRDAAPEILVGLSNDIHRNILQGMRGDIIGGYGNLRKLTDSLRDATMNLARDSPSFVAHEEVRKLMDGITALEDILICHESDAKAFEISKYANAKGDVDCGYSEQSRPSQEPSGDKEVPRLPRGRR